VPDNDYRQPPPNRIDVDAVIRRARRRRVPSQVGVALATTVAAIGIVGGGIFGLGQLPMSNSCAASSSSATSGSSDGAPVPSEFAPVSELCGSAAPSTAPRPNGLIVSANEDPLEVAYKNVAVVAQVRLTNTGPANVRGTIPLVAGVLVKDGVVVAVAQIQWSGRTIDLAPHGATVNSVRIPDRSCRSGAQLPRGDYELYGEVQLTIDGKPMTVAGRGRTVTVS
jgi:hypothetical protein